MNVAFIGIGVMGSGMAQFAEGRGGTGIHAHPRKAQGVLAQSGIWCDDIAGCVAGADAVITIVGYPRDVEEVYLAQTAS